MKRALICLGGFGHASSVLDDLLPARAEIEVAGVYPAFRGELFGGILKHPLLEKVEPGEFDTLPDAPDENAVAVVGTRLDRQAEAAARAARKGWHLIVEKPLATNEADLAELHREVARCGRRIMTMLTMRSLPVFREARDIVRSGELGRLALANFRKSYKWGQRPDWFGDAAKYPGTIPWVGIHAMDLMHFLSRQRIAAVAAFSGNFFHPERPACDDAATLILSGAEGLVGSASIDLLRPASAQEHGDDWVRIVGEDGILEAGAAQQTIRKITSQTTGKTSVCSSTPHPIFLDFVRNVPGPRIADEDIGFHLTDACLAANRSVVDGALQRIDPERWHFV